MDAITPQRCAELAAEMGLPPDPARDRMVAFFVAAEAQKAETEKTPAAIAHGFNNRAQLPCAAGATPGPVGRQAEGDKLRCLRPGEFDG